MNNTMNVKVELDTGEEVRLPGEPDHSLRYMESLYLNSPRFDPGTVTYTTGVVTRVDPDAMRRAIYRHLHGDWGDVCRENWESNDVALKEGSEIFSVYHDGYGVPFWIVTEANRSKTRVILPAEYYRR